MHMKRILGLATPFVALTLAAAAWAASFTSGNLVIYRHGDGSQTLTNTGNSVFLDEYQILSDGSGVPTNLLFVQSIMMPTNYFGANSPLIASGTAFADGMITRSQDGRFILVPGYGAMLGQITNFSIVSATGIEAPRVIALVDGSGNIDTTTVQTNSVASGDDFRSATSTDGTNIWSSGGSGGIRYATRGSAAATQLSSFATNIRQVDVSSNELYFSAQTGTLRIGIVTNGLNSPPVSTNGVFLNNLSGIGTNNSTSPFAFTLVNLTGGSAADTLYVADATEGAVKKFSLVSGAWVLNGSVSGIFGAYGVAGAIRVAGTVTNVELYVTGGGGTLTGGDNIIHVTDSGGFNAAPSGSPELFVSGAFNKGLRGITFAPVGSEAFPAGPGRLSVGPVLGLFASGMTGCSAVATQNYSVANFGTATVTWSATSDVDWVTLNPSSGSITSGGSVTVAAAFNANVTALSAGTNTASITFTNTTAAPDDLGTTTRAVRLILSDATVSPSSGLSAAGQPGGPFVPSNQVYVVGNGGTPVALTVSKTASWLDLSDSSVSLAACSSTNITISINQAVASGLSIGFYSDVVSFSNATSLIAARTVNLQVGSIYFCDDFSTYSSGNLVGQQGWTQHGATSANPIQIAGGKLAMPAGQSPTDGQDIFKNFTVTTSNSVYWGMSMAVTSCPLGAVSFIGGLCTSNNGTVSVGGSFLNYRLLATNDNSGFIAFAARTTGLSATPFTNGPFALTTGTVYRIVVQTDPVGSNTTVYVNPGSDINAETPYLVARPTGVLTGTGPGVTVGSILLSQFANTTVNNPGVLIDKMCVSTNYADVYSGITGGAPPLTPLQTWQFAYFGSTNSTDSLPDADPDGDGMSNTNEFLAGFNPTNNTASLKIINIVRTSGDVNVTYLGANGDGTLVPGPKTNVLEFTAGAAGSYSNNFTSTGQTNILTGGTGTGIVTNMIDAGAANQPSRYYRIRVLVP